MKNLLVMDVRFEPIGDSPEAVYAVPMPGFRAYARNDARNYHVEFTFTILFFVIQSERGYVPTSAVIRNVVARNLRTGDEYSVDGWLVIDPEPLVDYYELDFEEILSNQASEGSSEGEGGGTGVVEPEPSLLHLIGDQIARGAVNTPIDDMDTFLIAAFTLINAIQAEPYDESSDLANG